MGVEWGGVGDGHGVRTGRDKNGNIISEIV